MGTMYFYNPFQLICKNEGDNEGDHDDLNRKKGFNQSVHVA